MMKNNITAQTKQAIITLFAQHGQSAYFGEAVTQYEHAAQCALLAQQAGSDSDTIIAGLLHDIGHLLPSDAAVEHMDGYGRQDHEGLAAAWLLERGFSIKTADLIANHVNAKRYLVYAQPGYYDSLSEASRQTLAFQGGAMSSMEAALFEQHPHFEAILQMRRWDEAAKVVGMELPEIGYFLGQV